MIRLLTAEGMRELDRRTIAEFGLPDTQLMDVAGHALGRTALQMMAPGTRAVIVTGGGNNGGDGYATARHLLAAGVSVEVHAVGKLDRLPEAAAHHLAALRRAGVEPQPFSAERLAQAHLIIDALLGVGARGAPRPPLPEVIEAINASGVPVLAADVPSGFAVRARRTLCLGATKYECVVYPGAEFAGEVSADPIGTPPAAWDGLQPDLGLLEAADVAALLPLRPPTGHKGTFGKVAVVAGSRAYSGAALMAAQGALRSGAGLIFLAVPEDAVPLVAGRVPEVIIRSYNSLSDLLSSVDAVALGSGLGRDDAAQRVVTEVLTSWHGPLVVDADGLALAGLEGLRAASVITPHPGEAARLLGLSTKEVQADRLAAARRLARETGSVAVLKGARTLVALDADTVRVNPTGNSGLGTGGTGDVLTGLVGGLLAQGLRASDAALAGVYLHGLAGDLAAGRLGRRGMGSSDVAAMLPEAYRVLLGPDA